MDSGYRIFIQKPYRFPELSNRAVQILHSDSIFFQWASGGGLSDQWNRMEYHITEMILQLCFHSQA